MGVLARSSVLLTLVLSAISTPPQPALAAGRCASTVGGVEQRVADFWQCVGSLGASDLLTAEDLGQWARNVIERAPGAGIHVVDFRASTVGMQDALDRASAGVAPAPPKSADVESRIALFWQKVNALGSCEQLTATDLGQWALNVIDRDPSKRIRVDDFRTSTADMQAGLDRTRCPVAVSPNAACPGATGPYAICGRVTSALTGAPLVGADVTAAIAHTFSGPVKTDAKGAYTITVPAAGPWPYWYWVSVKVDAATGLAPYWNYGGTPCETDSKTLDVQGHIDRVDIAVPRGRSISGSLRDSTGATIAAEPSVMKYMPANDDWCVASSASATPQGSETYRVRVAEGTYRIKFDPFQYGLQTTFPMAWHPSAPTPNSAADVVADRDRTGTDVSVPKGYTVSGRIRVSGMDEVPIVQALIVDGGKISVASDCCYSDYAALTYSFVLPPGTYKIRIWERATSRKQEFTYHATGGATYASGQAVVVTNAARTGIDIVR